MADWDDDEKVARREQTPRSGGLRHDVAIPARIEWIGDDVDAEILDVSTSGMYLRVAMFIEQGDANTLAIGSTVTVYFSDPADRSAPEVSLRGDVARRDPHGIGIRFSELSADARRVLRTIAVRAVEARTRGEDAAPDRQQRAQGPKIDARLVSSACLKVLERRLGNVMWTLRAELVSQLRAMGPAGKDAGEGSAREDAELIEEKATAISRTAERRVLQSFAEIAGLDATQQIVLSQLKRDAAAAVQVSEDKLGIVGNRADDSRVILQDSCKRLEKALASKSFDVNVRLANVLRRRIDEDNANPLLPAVMGRILWQSVTGYCDTPRVHTCLRVALLRAVTPLLAELYDQLGETLDEHGVPESYWMGEGKAPR